ncbi:MAG: RNA 3'-phosphate cyclase [Promethearchaeia archaeon]|nr:MAG: RNA 3'-phosphate cyclase [Candidatus Lokiarchaeia archaeon]
MEIYVDIDGSIGEGGGSILRVAAAVACCIQKGIRISKIRANRKNPGLKMQHLVGIQALKHLTQGKTSSIQEGSINLEFLPGSERHHQFSVDIHTAGSVSLLTQTLQNSLIIPHAAHSQYTIEVFGGGTYVLGAPGTSYIEEVLFHIFRNLGYECHLIVHQHGYYPKGGARCTLKFKPQLQREKYKNFHCINRGEVTGIYVIIHAHENLRKAQVAERICNTIHKTLFLDLREKAKYYCEKNYHSSLSVGVGIDGWLEFDSGIRIGIGTLLGKRGLSSEELGKQVSYQFNSLYRSSYTVDPYAADQILPFLLLSQSDFEFTIQKLTSHFQTNVKILDILLQQRPKIIQHSDHFLITNS